MTIAMDNDREVDLEDLAAELTSAAYPVVLRHGAGDKWLDLELDLWKALTDRLKRLERTEGDCNASYSATPKTSDLFG